MRFYCRGDFESPRQYANPNFILLGNALCWTYETASFWR